MTLELFRKYNIFYMKNIKLSLFSYSSAHGGDYGFASSAGSPMSVATAGGQPGNGSQSPSGSSGDENITSCQTGNGGQTGNGRKVSSHYAQISPLRGQGLPHPSVMGIPQNTGGHNSVSGSPVKSYFQVNNKLIFLSFFINLKSRILSRDHLSFFCSKQRHRTPK